MKNKTIIVVICGPTASGKTGLALQLAKELEKVNILSVDSRQVYKGLSIITGKDIPKNLPKNIKVFGLDIYNQDQIANLGEFVRYSQNIISKSIDTQTPLIIVGGTGLYLKAITQDLNFVSIPPDDKLREELEKMPLSDLQERLKKENPNKFSTINHSDLMNPRRLIRYIEISRSKVKSVAPDSTTNNISFHWIGLLPDKNIIKESIHNRVIERIQSGAIDEVIKLQKNYPNKKTAIHTSLGVSQISLFLEGKISKDKLVEDWTNAEVDYARRQIVWFKKQPRIVWYDNSTNRDSLINKLKKIYQKNA